MKYLLRIFSLFVGFFIFCGLFFLFNTAEVSAEIGAICSALESDSCGDGERCLDLGSDGTICVSESAGDACRAPNRWTERCNDGYGPADITRSNGTTACICMPELGADSSSGSGTSVSGNVDYDAWRQSQIDAANSVERGIFTEGLSTECMAFGDCKTCDIMKVVSNIFRLAFEIVGIVAVAVITMGGFAYVRSGGNEETITAAKKTITAAILGTLIVFAAWVIINTILNLTGFNAGGGTWWNPSC